MFKKLVVAAAVALGLVGGAVASDFETAVNSTVRLVDSSGSATCSAVIIGPHVVERKKTLEDGTVETTTINSGPRVVTAKHCVNGGKGFSISVPSYNKDGLLVKEERYLLGKPREFGKRDVVVMTFVSDVLPEFPMADVVTERNLKFGDELTHIGFPVGSMPENTGDHRTITTGLFQEYTSVDDSPTFIRTNVPAWYGSSGGGLWKVTDGNYELVGLTSKGDVRDAPWLFVFYSPVEVDTLK